MQKNNDRLTDPRHAAFAKITLKGDEEYENGEQNRRENGVEREEENEKINEKINKNTFKQRENQKEKRLLTERYKEINSNSSIEPFFNTDTSNTILEFDPPLYATISSEKLIFYDEKEITSIVKNFPDRHTVNADEVIRRYYWEKLSIFIQDYKEDYLKIENPEKNDYEAIFKWYANEVKKEIQAVNDDNELKDDIYERKVSEHERKVGEHYNNKLQAPLIISVAGGAIGSFVLLIFIFIIVKIERNLRKLD